MAFTTGLALKSAWAGLLAGCLHTLTGPDHLAALAPLTVGPSRAQNALMGGAVQSIPSTRTVPSLWRRHAEGHGYARFRYVRRGERREQRRERRHEIGASRAKREEIDMKRRLLVKT
jgi:hypothetical protein